MSITLIIALCFCIILIMILIISFNKLSTNKNQIQNAISSLDALFIKRAELIPNLVAVLKQYMTYEKDTLSQIVQQRQSSMTNQIEYQMDNESNGMLKKVLLQVENYPDLKANTQFTNLQYSFNECEEQIAAGRRFLSTSITEYNNSVATFPANIIAVLFGFRSHEWEYASTAQRQNVDASQLLK